MICPLCNRELGKQVSTHHLVPVLKGGKNGAIVRLHKVCHDKIHSLFSESQIKKYYNTIDKLLTNDNVINFVRWLQNKDIDFYDSSKKEKYETK
jgi:hypothetical protein